VPCALLSLCMKGKTEVVRKPRDVVDSVEGERKRLEFPRPATDDALCQRCAGYASRVEGTGSGRARQPFFGDCAFALSKC